MPEQIKHYEEEMAKHSEDQAMQRFVQYFIIYEDYLISDSFLC